MADAWHRDWRAGQMWALGIDAAVAEGGGLIPKILSVELISVTVEGGPFSRNPECGERQSGDRGQLLYLRKPRARGAARRFPRAASLVMNP